MAAVDSVAEMTSLLEQWNREHPGGTSPVNVLHKMAELVERETEAYYKMDPDPFDDRHPGRANPTCAFGHVMKVLFKNEDFMNKLVSEYMLGNRDQTDIQTASSRLMLTVLPGVETSIVFQETEGLVRILLHWAETAPDPLRSYATGLLAGAMELKDVAANFKEANGRLVPLMLKRLHELRMQMEKEKSPQMHSSERPFVVFAKDEKNKIQEESSKFNSEEGQPPKKKEEHVNHVQETLLSCETNATPNRKAEKPDRHTLMKRALSPSYCREDFFKPKKARTADDSLDIEWSNSSWADMEPYVIGTFSLHPLTCAMKQRLILQYLTPMGEYQEHITIAMEHNAMELIFYYIDSKQNRDIRLSFEALKYLATLLCHKKFAVDFLQQSGVQKLLDVYRPSVAATGVSLCLYYVSYFEDVMERVCLLPDHVLSKMVSYVLWLLECSHDSSRFHAVIFFSQAFQFKVILNLFDHKDGFRRLLNMISTLRILNANDTDISDLSDDEIFTMRSAVRYVVMALKRYFEAHLMHKAHEIRRSHARNDGGTAVMETPDYKAIKLSPDVVQENIELMIELMPLRMHWKPETVLYNLGGLRLLSFIIASAPNWLNFNGKAETIIAALDILAVCTVCAFSQLQLLNSVDMGNDVKTPFMSVLIGLAEGDVISDPEIQKSALHVIINCVCGPLGKLGGFVGHFMSGISKKKNTARSGEGVLCSMWNGIRDNNGIMVLLKLLSIKMPITEADCIRALACKALWGMSRSETMRQIISKLPLFNNGELQRLMREPVLQDKRMEHVKFCKYASELLERVSGKNAQNSPWESSMDEIRRADIVAQTRIMYLEKDLLQLIHSHLQAKGLTEAAAALQKEADLPRSTTPPAIHPKNPHIFNSPQSLPTTPKFTRNPISSLTTSSNHSSPSLHTPGPASCLHHNGTVCTPSSQTDASSQSSGSSNTPGPGAGPLRFSLSRQHSQNTPTAIVSQPNKCRFFKEKMGHGHSPSLKNKIYKDKGADFDMTLDKLVTEYLRKQHALCRAPISTCPPMSLFEPHTCPLPRGKRCAPTNVLARSHYRSIHPRFGGINGASLDRKFIYSRFNHVKTFRDTEEDGFSCCSFLTKQNALLLGTYGGDIKVFSLSTSEEIETLAAHGAPLSQVIPTKDEKFLLTSFSGWGDMNGAGLWSYESDGLISKYTFDDKYVEFSHSEDQIIGTREEKANVYDTRTGELVVSLYDDAKANNYNLNRATFNPTDELVLNDGVLWDLRSKKAIHKFDKFNQNISGIFHPMGLEIIINSEVWDIRTFQLLHTVPSLDQCLLRFTSIGDVIYAIHLDPEFDLSEERMKSPYETTFRTMDATDYSPIVTYDLKCRSISCISADSADSYLAVVENSQFSEASSDDCSCKLYEIGKLREDDDTQGDDEEEEDLNPDDEDDVLNLDSNDDDDDDDDIDDDDDDENPLNESNLDSDDNEPISISDEDGVDDEDGWEDVDVDDEDDDVDDILFQLV